MVGEGKESFLLLLFFVYLVVFVFPLEFSRYRQSNYAVCLSPPQRLHQWRNVEKRRGKEGKGGK